MQLQFDASTVAPAEAGLPVWEGPVLVRVTRTEVQETAAKNGNKMLVLHVNAIDGQYRGQDQVIRLNLWNNNAQAADIAQRQLSSICHVTGRMQITDTDMLIGVPFVCVYAKEERPITDQQTGQTRNVESCQAKDYRMADGRTIKEVVAGQPAASPYVPSGSTGAAAPQAAQHGGNAPQPGNQPQFNGPAAGAQQMPQGGAQFGGGQPQPQFSTQHPMPGQPGGPGFQPGAPQPGPQPGQFAPTPGSPAFGQGQGAMGPGPAQGQNGFGGGAPQPGNGGAGYPSSPQPGAPGFGGGFPQPGGPAPGTGGPQAGFGGGGQFQPGAPGGPGPWGPQGGQR